MSEFMRVEDLQVYQRLCDLHLEVCDLSHAWPAEERYELGTQARRSSNSSPAQLAEKHSDRHVRNKIEGVNRGRCEALETVHHLYMAFRKRYIDQLTFESYRDRYHECVRMLNGLERKLELKLDPSARRFPPQSATSSGQSSSNTEP
jgi:four helix bundle protein